ncbi:uncharacterized protein CEXT_729782 [Caerostris extrusa]|uniref:Uncharacterized protein n=1 Tax=Caerostris extrusa TaxID=172846 RepID=A0AAV4TUT6_CAEEX|nr:uncharacterized protein CEXT_729782 [Caerostris extrusa]
MLNGTLPLGDCTNTLIQPQSDINKCFDSKCLSDIPLDSIQNKQENNEANSELLPINSIDIKPEADILPQKQFNLKKIEQEFESSEADIVAQTQSDLKLVKVENSETELEIKNSNAGDLSAINLNKESDPVALHVFENKPIVENSLPPMHVHVSPPIPTFVVEAPQENETFLEILENKSHDYKDADSNIASLPSVAESDEISSLPSNGLEKSKDAEADVPGTALKELEKHSTPTATSKSTLIIHSVQRPDNSMSESLEASPASHVSKDSRTSYSESVPSSPSPGMADGDRSRPKEKKTLMGTLRRRLSFHKNRSKSAENRFESASNFSQASSRSTSADRVRQVSAQKLSPFKGKFLGSTRSSLSEASGISASSSRTYINENSTLIIETNENGIIKRYLILILLSIEANGRSVVPSCTSTMIMYSLLSIFQGQQFAKCVKRI